jgi:D-glycero-D-manno-heptose 1,7-bisphosphate phosphatase
MVTNPSRLKKGVFLDRDGVLIETFIKDGKPIAISKISELVILPLVKESIQELVSRNFEVVVVTNQPDVSKGVTSLSQIQLMHNEISDFTGIQHFYMCTHLQSSNCDCRKPRTGLLNQAAQELGLDLSKSFLVGDRWSDIDAGNNANCNCFFIDYGYDEKMPSGNFQAVSSLHEAVSKIIQEGD